MAEKKRYSKRYCRYTESKIEFIDYKDIDMLKHSLSERYKIMPRRLTGNSKKWQERVEVAIKRARQMALIPYIVDRKRVVENPFKIWSNLLDSTLESLLNLSKFYRFLGVCECLSKCFEYWLIALQK